MGPFGDPGQMTSPAPASIDPKQMDKTNNSDNRMNFSMPMASVTIAQHPPASVNNGLTGTMGELSSLSWSESTAMIVDAISSESEGSVSSGQLSNPTQQTVPLHWQMIPSGMLPSEDEFQLDDNPVNHLRQVSDKQDDSFCREGYSELSGDLVKNVRHVANSFSQISYSPNEGSSGFKHKQRGLSATDSGASVRFVTSRKPTIRTAQDNSRKHAPYPPQEAVYHTLPLYENHKGTNEARRNCCFLYTHPLVDMFCNVAIDQIDRIPIFGSRTAEPAGARSGSISAGSLCVSHEHEQNQNVAANMREIASLQTGNGVSVVSNRKKKSKGSSRFVACGPCNLSKQKVKELCAVSFESV